MTTRAHLLIVDDDARIRDLLQRFLGDKGYRISVAADAAEARRKMVVSASILLILDVMMPRRERAVAHPIAQRKQIRAGHSADRPVGSGFAHCRP